jgi:putative tRNA adenosine deaminase-associated protein
MGETLVAGVGASLRVGKRVGTAKCLCHSGHVLLVHMQPTGNTLATSWRSEVAMSEQIDGIDFAVAAYREEGEWQVQELVHDVLGDVPALAGALRRFPGDGGAIGMVAIDEDFFVIVRVAGPSVRILLSDITAAEEWELASSAVDELGLPEPEDEDEQAPAGDLDILGDLGMAAMDMGVLLDDFDLYPDEMLSDVARRLGFGSLFDEAVGLTSA